MTADQHLLNGKIAVGARLYAEKRKPNEKMAPHRFLLAISTLLVYTAWPYFLFILLLFSWYPPILLVNLILFSTVLMPAKLFWPEFLNLSVFETWREYFSFSYKFEGVLLGSRKGFIKMALANGADLLPVYHFGNSRVLGIGPRSLMTFCRKMRFSMGILMGRWGLPIPREVPIYMVVGKPVSVERVPWDSPKFNEKVNELHGRFQKELHRLYEENKAEYGWEKRPLVIA